MDGIDRIIEIGPSAGQGSTRAIFDGVRSRTSSYELHLVEIDNLRCQLLRKKFRKNRNIHIHHASSVLEHDFPAWGKVEDFYVNVQTNLNRKSIDIVRKWYDSEINRIILLPASKKDAIRKILKSSTEKVFDLALIDGGEFTGLKEVQLLYGTRIFVLDDINSFKCFDAYCLLKNSSDYELYCENWNLRNGFAVFLKVN